MSPECDEGVWCTGYTYQGDDRGREGAAGSWRVVIARNKLVAEPNLAKLTAGAGSEAATSLGCAQRRVSFMT